MSDDATLQKTAQEAAERAIERTLEELRSYVHPEYLTTKQAAAYLNFSAQHLEIMRHRGTGPHYIKMPQRVRYRRADLDAWMERYREETAKDPEQGAA